jgi:hypothetical protein
MKYKVLEEYHYEVIDNEDESLFYYLPINL